MAKSSIGCAKLSQKHIQIRHMMEENRNIRNVSMIGFHNHGKRTLANYLVGRAGINLEKDGPSTSEPNPNFYQKL